MMHANKKVYMQCIEDRTLICQEKKEQKTGAWFTWMILEKQQTQYGQLILWDGNNYWIDMHAKCCIGYTFKHEIECLIKIHVGTLFFNESVSTKFIY